jgi:hypothetical protein
MKHSTYTEREEERRWENEMLELAVKMSKQLRAEWRNMQMDNLQVLYLHHPKDPHRSPMLRIYSNLPPLSIILRSMAYKEMFMRRTEAAAAAAKKIRHERDI